MMRVIIADDESPARERLRHLLATESDIEIVAECCDGDQTLHRARELRPDLVFLDIAMPGRTGLVVAQELAQTPATRVIFTTAHAEPAVNAFDLEAVDYLLKPFSRARFSSALQRARRGSPPDPSTLADPAPPPGADRFLVRTGTGYRVVEVACILSVQAAANYVVIHTTTGKHIMRSTLRQITAELCPRRFHRTSRSSLVNLDAVREIRPNPSGSLAVVLSDGSDVPLTTGIRDFELRLRQRA